MKKIKSIVALGLLIITSVTYAQDDTVSQTKEKLFEHLFTQLKNSVKKKNLGKLYPNFDLISNFQNIAPDHMKTVLVDSGMWQLVDTTNGVSETEMLEKATVLSFFESLMLVNEMINNGEFDEIPTHRVVFIKEQYNNNQILLAANRRYDGSFRIYLREINTKNKWKFHKNKWWSKLTN